MGKNPCPLCGTPESTAKNENLVCHGCGTTPLKLVTEYLNRPLKPVNFADATFAYERSPFATRMSFGEWLTRFGLELVGKP